MKKSTIEKLKTRNEVRKRKYVTQKLIFYALLKIIGGRFQRYFRKGKTDNHKRLLKLT